MIYTNIPFNIQLIDFWEVWHSLGDHLQDQFHAIDTIPAIRDFRCHLAEPPPGWTILLRMVLPSYLHTGPQMLYSTLAVPFKPSVPLQAEGGTDWLRSQGSLLITARCYLILGGMCHFLPWGKKKKKIASWCKMGVIPREWQGGHLEGKYTRGLVSNIIPITPTHVFPRSCHRSHRPQGVAKEKGTR